MITLNIRWNGDVPGIDAHRLSVQHFGVPLRCLLMAIRRTANNMLRQGYAKGDVNRGRVAAEADSIDLQIAAVYQSSLGIENVIAVQMPVGQMNLMPEQLAGDALDRFLVDLERETQGVRRNISARRFLSSLPPGLASQEYKLVVDGELKRTVSLGRVQIPVPLDSLPFLAEVTGNVIGVGFDPGRHFVRIKSVDPAGTETTFQATADQVTAALELRSDVVRAVAVIGLGGKRLLRIQGAADHRFRLDVNSFVFDKWKGVLAELAR